MWVKAFGSCLLSRLCLQKGGGASWFQTKAAALEREVANAEREAGGNQEELELNLKRVSAAVATKLACLAAPK